MTGLPTVFDAVEQHLREKFGSCTIVFSGSRVAGLDRRSSDVDAIVIGSRDGTYFTRLGDLDLFIDVELYDEQTFISHSSFPLMTKLLLYPVHILGNINLIQEKQNRMAASLPASSAGIVEAFHRMAHGYRVRKFAKAGILEERLSYIRDLQRYGATPQPVTSTRLLSDRVSCFLSDILTNPLHAASKVIGVMARRAEELHWASYDSPLQAAYGTTPYAKMSDVLHELQRRVFHHGFAKILRAEDLSNRMLRESTQLIRA